MANILEGDVSGPAHHALHRLLEAEDLQHEGAIKDGTEQLLLFQKILVQEGLQLRAGLRRDDDLKGISVINNDSSSSSSNNDNNSPFTCSIL